MCIRDRDQAWNRLKSLLQSNAGDIAAILLGFTLFSVLKPFFPQFHRLDRSTPYLQVKKHFSEQLAICVSCMDPVSYTHLDVYKRQRMWGWTGGATNITKNPLVNPTYVGMDRWDFGHAALT